MALTRRPFTFLTEAGLPTMVATGAAAPRLMATSLLYALDIMAKHSIVYNNENARVIAGKQAGIQGKLGGFLTAVSKPFLQLCGVYVTIV